MPKNNNKIIMLIIGEGLFFWLIFYSGIVCPFINPSLEEYKTAFMSFPRDYTQKLIWYVLHFPSSFIIDKMLNDYEILQLLSIIQTCIITYVLDNRKKVFK